VEQLLEVGAHRSVRHAEPLRDLLIGQAVRGERQNLRLARRQATAAEVGSAVPAAQVPVRESHRFITRSAENTNATLSCVYL
jgi:hypothetical protein